MSTIDTIIKLIDAGFSKDDITKLIGNNSDDMNAEPSVESKDETSASEDSGDNNDNNTNSENTVSMDVFTKLSAQVENLTKLVQNKNIRDDTVNSASNSDSIEDIFNKLLN